MGIFSRKESSTQAQTRAMLHIVLEHTGTPLYEMQTCDFTKDIIIGRASDCTWSLDGVDLSASSRHAVISHRKSHFYITDLGSRNGIYFQNKRIKERKLAPGDRINLGECVVVVEASTPRAASKSRHHRLFYTNEKGKSIVVEITKPRTILGSANDCDLIFQDQLISAHHTELILKNDGSCWIRDLGSRNGTSVNGTELLADGERMLQDNDTITIAYLDLKFWDAAFEHEESRVLSAVLVIILTVIVILGAYIGINKMSPDAYVYLDMATEAMQKNDLSKAEKILIDLVPQAKGDKEITVESRRQELLRQIKLWKDTQEKWELVKGSLNAGDFGYAVEKVSSLEMNDINAWNWTGGVTEKRRALAVKKMLDACYSAKACLENPLSSAEDLEQCCRNLKSSVAECTKYKDAYLGKAVSFGNPLLKDIEKTLDDGQKLQQTLGMLNTEKPDYEAIMKKLDAIKKDSRGAIQIQAEKVMPSVITLNRETQKSAMMINKVCDLDFRSIQNFNLDLPDEIDYSSEKNIGSLKKQLENSVERLKEIARQLSQYYGNLVVRGISPGRPVPYLPSFQNPEIMEKVYRIDTMDHPFPKLSRTEPVGEYDKLLGMEYFYEFISNIDTRSLIWNGEDFPQKPYICLMKENMAEIEQFVSYAERDAVQPFKQGKFAEYLDFCKKILKERDEFVEAQLKRPDKPGTREFLISRGMAVYFMPEGKRKNDLIEEIGDSFSQLRREVGKLKNKYDEAVPEDALRLRTEIIKKGLPGDRTVTIMWTQMPSNGWGK